MEKIICPNCGHDMIDKSVGDAIEVICPNCGNGWASYDNRRLDALYSDKAIYKIFIDEKECSTTLLKELASIFFFIFLNAKKMLSNKSNFTSGKAPEVLPIVKKLYKSGLPFHIVPDFRHEIK